MEDKTNTLIMIEQLKMFKNEQLETLLQGKIVFRKDNKITVKQENPNNITFLVSFGKKVTFENVQGSALLNFNYTKETIDRMKKLFEQYEALNYSYYMIKSFDFSTVKRNNQIELEL